MKTEEFKFENNLPITVLPLLKNEENWFIANDVCAILGLGNVTKSIDRLDEDEKQLVKIDYKGQVRPVNIVNESGLYALVITSTKPEAKSFRKWITSEVLPCIRKAGKYTTEQAQAKQLELKSLTNEIEKIELEIESLKKETRNLTLLKEEKHKLMRKLINSDDSQLEIGFSEEKTSEEQV